MLFKDFNSFLTWGAKGLGKGPFCFIFAEDNVELISTVKHHQSQKFKKIIVIGDDINTLTEFASNDIILVNSELPISGDVSDLLNKILPLIPDQWVYYGYNAEYLFYPFCESRSIGELTTFSAEERRRSILTYAIDLYAPDLNEDPSGVNKQKAHLDKSGYYSLGRQDKENNYLDRQLDFFGGLRWRFEEYIPAKKRKIDRISLFRVEIGLTVKPDYTFNHAEYNTYACPWHHSITATTCSFRTAKALKRNPGSTFDIQSFYWHNSIGFEWSSQQLMDLGLMEPGQWF